MFIRALLLNFSISSSVARVSSLKTRLCLLPSCARIFLKNPVFSSSTWDFYSDVDVEKVQGIEEAVVRTAPNDRASIKFLLASHFDVIDVTVGRGY